jgi:hypothetical protein
MPKAKVAELLSLAGELATQYHMLMTRGRAEVKLDHYIAPDVHYLKLKEFFAGANPVLEQVTPLLSPLFAVPGLGTVVGGGFSLATEASRQAAGRSAAKGGITFFDSLPDTLFQRVSAKTMQQEITSLEQQIAEKKRSMERRRQSRASTARSRELERTLAAQQTLAMASQPIEVAIETVPAEFETVENEQGDIHYFFGKKRKSGKKKRRLAAEQLRQETEEALAAKKEELRALQEQEQSEEASVQEAEHASTIERVMRSATMGGGEPPVGDPSLQGFGMDSFNHVFDTACCCKGSNTAMDYELLNTSPASLTGYARMTHPSYDDNRVIYVNGGTFAPLEDRLANYTAWAVANDAPLPTDMLLDLAINTALDCQGCCKDERDYDCACCLQRDYYDAAFQAEGRLPAGPFFSSTWVDARLADMPDGTYGMVDTGSKPFKVTINRNVELPRAQVSFAHEMLHVMNDLHKLGLPHDQLHNAAVMLVGEVLPGLNAITAAAKH